jgi:hypothetical protein
MVENNKLRQNSGVFGRWKQILLPPFQIASTAGQMPMNREIQEMSGSVEAKQMQIYVSATRLKF